MSTTIKLLLFLHLSILSCGCASGLSGGDTPPTVVHEATETTTGELAKLAQELDTRMHPDEVGQLHDILINRYVAERDGRNWINVFLENRSAYILTAMAFQLVEYDTSKGKYSDQKGTSDATVPPGISTNAGAVRFFPNFSIPEVYGFLDEHSPESSSTKPRLAEEFSSQNPEIDRRLFLVRDLQIPISGSTEKPTPEELYGCLVFLRGYTGGAHGQSQVYVKVVEAFGHHR